MATEVVISGRSKWGDFPGGPVVKTLSSDAGGTGPIPGWGAKIPHASWPKKQNRKQKQYCNKLKTFKNGPHWDLPGGPLVNNPPVNAGDTDSIPSLGRFHMPQGN